MSKKNYRTFKKEKRLYFVFSIVMYFLPFIIVTCCLLPLLTETTGSKLAIGFGVICINSIPFLLGMIKSFFVHFPMCNLLAIVFLFLGAFFRSDVFKSCADTFMWIELSAGIGSVISCVLWGKYGKYKRYSESVKATVASEAFVLKQGE